jgi:aryl-phospho-beta-D-glucosidase BglC (GH1 family)
VDEVKDHLMAEVHSYSPYRFAFDTDSPQEIFDANCDAEVRAIIARVGKYLVGRGIPCVLGEYGADTSKRQETELAKQAACYVSAAAAYNIPCFYWMALSDGADRSVPKWTKPTLKDAILKSYRDSKSN